MKPARLLFSVMLAALAVLSPERSNADPLPAGSYQGSCYNYYASGGLLTATCGNGIGGYITTQLEYANCSTAVWNQFGHLVCVGGVPGGTYKQSCTNISFDGSFLAASCRKMDGTWVATWVNFPSANQCRGDLGNANGVLTFQSGYKWACDQRAFNETVTCWSSTNAADCWHQTYMYACSNLPPSDYQDPYGGLPDCRNVSSTPCCVDYAVNDMHCSG
jgi:hypothetical protein